MNRVVFIAYYHAGYTDDPSQILALCDSKEVAQRVIESHKVGSTRDREYEDKARWWIAETEVLSSAVPSKSGEVTILMVLLVAVCVSGFVGLCGRGGFHDRSAAATVIVSGTNVTVSIDQQIHPSGGGSVALK